MLEKIHGKHRTLSAAALDVAKTLEELDRVERELAVLYELQAEDQQRRLHSETKVFSSLKFDPICLTVEVSIGEVIRQKRDQLMDLMGQAGDAQRAVNDAYLRLLNYEPPHERKPEMPAFQPDPVDVAESALTSVEQPIGKPLVGPGREV